MRKQTKAELADAAWQSRGERQGAITARSYRAVIERLAPERLQEIRDIAGVDWEADDPEDDRAIDRELRELARRQRRFVDEVDDPLEIHAFTCLHQDSDGIKHLLKLVKNPACDAGRAMQLYWLNDPGYYSAYPTISACEDSWEKEWMRLLRAIRLRFAKDDFATAQIPFDPRPWAEDDDVDLDALKLPATLLEPIHPD